MSSTASGNDEPTAPGGTEPTAADRSIAPATEGSAQSTAAGERETAAVGGTEPTAAERETTASASTDRMPEDETDQERSGRRPEGPAHAREGSALQTIKRTLTEFSEDNLTDSAAALTYYAILSIFPALLALVAIVGLVGDPHTVTKEMTTLVTSIGPASAAQTFKAPIEGLTKSSGTAGILLIVGIASALWTASGYVGAFMRASNVIYEVEEGRSIIKRRPLQMLVTLVLVILLALVLVALVLTGPLASKLGSAVGIGSSAVTVWNIAKWPVLLIVVSFMIALLYYASPNAKLRSLRSIVPGAFLAVVVWLVASAAFAFYVANFGSYNKTYGAIGGIIIFLVWMWITNVAILLGVEINAERERSRQLRDGTPGAEREIQLPERSQPKTKKRARTV
jgi:membrane protein